MKKLTIAIALLALPLASCVQFTSDGSIVGIWTASFITSSAFDGDDAITCETQVFCVNMDKDGAITIVQTSVQEEDDSDCGQPERVVYKSTSTGTWTAFTDNNDGGTQVHTRTTHHTSSTTYGDEDPETYEDTTTQEGNSSVARGTDDIGKFLIWDNTIMRVGESC